MAQEKELTLAIERYDRHFPFFDGTVKAPDGSGKVSANPSSRSVYPSSPAPTPRVVR